MKFSAFSTSLALLSIVALSQSKPMPQAGTQIPTKGKVKLPPFPKKPSFAIGKEVPVTFSVFSPQVVQKAGGSVDLILKNTGVEEGGSSMVSDVPYNTGTACATMSLPSKDYSGVAMTFYTLGRKTASGNSGKNDEQDFELMGSSGKFITNAFLDGQQSNYVEHPRTETRYEFCISYDGTTTRYYQNGVELPDTAKELAFDEPQYTWFSIWVPGNIWKNCCGALPSPTLTPQWVQTIENFSLYVAS